MNKDNVADRLISARTLLENNKPEDAKAILLNTISDLKNRINQAEAYELLGVAAYQMSDMRLAAKAYFDAAQKDELLRSQLEHFSSFLFCLHYLENITPADISRNIFFYNSFYINTNQYNHSHWYEEMVNSPFEKRIRVGYLSADWREHAMANFLTPFLWGWEHSKIKPFVYCLNQHDDMTDMFRAMVPGNRWRDVYQVSPGEVAELIYNDGIDILVDLCGHTHGGISLMTMAYKPAPIQMSALGWINTTGLEQIDFYMTDEFSRGQKEDDLLFCEDFAVIKGPQLCFSPPNIAKYQAAAVANVKKNIRDSGCRMASFSNFDKLTDSILLAWGKVLEAVDGSSILLKDTTCISSRQKALRKRIDSILPEDIAERITLEQATEGYLFAYGEIDIALDTYPYTGGATICDALAMGVPVVSIRGDSPGRRFGSSILHYIGLDSLIADNMEEYAKKIAALAMDKPMQKQLHKYLLNNFWVSELTDIESYKKRLEKLYSDIVIRAVDIFQGKAIVKEGYDRACAKGKE